MPTDPLEALRRHQAETAEALKQQQEEEARRAPAVELWAAWEELKECTVQSLGLVGSPDADSRFYEAFATRMIRVALIIKSQGRLPELAKWKGRETALDHAINLMQAAAEDLTVSDLVSLLRETAKAGEFIGWVGIRLRYGLRDLLFKQEPERVQEGEAPTQIVQRDGRTEARDKWLYGQAKKKNPPTWRSLAIQLSKVAERRGWTKLTTPQAVKQAVGRYIRRHGLAPLPARKEG